MQKNDNGEVKEYEVNVYQVQEKRDLDDILCLKYYIAEYWYSQRTVCISSTQIKL